MDKLTQAGWPSFHDCSISLEDQEELKTIWLVSVDDKPKVWTDDRSHLSSYIQGTIDSCKDDQCEQSILQKESLSKALAEEKPLTINLHRTVRSWIPGRTTSELAHSIRIERLPKINVNYLEEETTPEEEEE